MCSVNRDPSPLSGKSCPRVRRTLNLYSDGPLSRRTSRLASIVPVDRLTSPSENRSPERRHFGRLLAALDRSLDQIAVVGDERRLYLSLHPDAQAFDLVIFAFDHHPRVRYI